MLKPYIFIDNYVKHNEKFYLLIFIFNPWLLQSWRNFSSFEHSELTEIFFNAHQNHTCSHMVSAFQDCQTFGCNWVLLTPGIPLIPSCAGFLSEISPCSSTLTFYFQCHPRIKGRMINNVYALKTYEETVD